LGKIKYRKKATPKIGIRIKLGELISDTKKAALEDLIQAQEAVQERKAVHTKKQMYEIWMKQLGALARGVRLRKDGMPMTGRDTTGRRNPWDYGRKHQRKYLTKEARERARSGFYGIARPEWGVVALMEPERGYRAKDIAELLARARGVPDVPNKSVGQLVYRLMLNGLAVRVERVVGTRTMFLYYLTALGYEEKVSGRAKEKWEDRRIVPDFLK